MVKLPVLRSQRFHLVQGVGLVRKQQGRVDRLPVHQSLHSVLQLAKVTGYKCSPVCLPPYNRSGGYQRKLLSRRNDHNLLYEIYSPLIIPITDGRNNKTCSVVSCEQRVPVEHATITYNAVCWPTTFLNCYFVIHVWVLLLKGAPYRAGATLYHYHTTYESKVVACLAC